jgi:hypothetical protein
MPQNGSNRRISIKRGKEEKMPKKIIFILVLLLSIAVIICGCEKQGAETGNDEAAGQTEENADEAAGEAAEEPDRDFTLEMYLDISMGSTYEEVSEILGDPGEASVDGDVLKQYIWENEDGSNISVTFDSNKATAKTQAYLGPYLRGGDQVTKKMFHQLSEGSSLSEAEEILGKGTETMRQILSGEESVTYQWSNSDGSGITIVIKNGKAADINDLMLD